jgi:hypothetical protein
MLMFLIELLPDLLITVTEHQFCKWLHRRLYGSPLEAKDQV